MFFITVIYIEYENENDEEQVNYKMIESILKDIEKEEFEEKNALLKIKSDEEKMKKAKSS